MERVPQPYPKTSEKPPLGSVFETFGAAATPLPQFSFAALMTPLLPRFWFEPEDGVHLLQIQPDRLMHNWRKVNDDIYPRYEPIRARFFDEVQIVAAFLDREGLDSIKPNQCEVTYVNTIVLPDGTNPHAHLERITPLWREWQNDADLAPIENASLTVKYVMRSDEIPLGRVYIEFKPVVAATDASPAINLQITARGKPQDNTIGGAFRLLDAGRRAVVRTFKRVTTAEMHSVWGNIDAS